MKHSAAIGLVLLLLGCSTDARRQTTTTTDSAGVQIVESFAPQWDSASGWAVTEVPILDLTTSGTGPAHEFYQVRAALRLPGGGFAVANYAWGEVRLFDASGRHLRSVGRKGEGPGEYQRIETLSLMPGDSIAVADYWLRRITILSPEGEVGRVISLHGVADRVRHVLSLGDSGFVGFSYSYASLPDEPGNYRMPYQVMRLGLEGAVLDTIAEIGGFEGSQGPAGDASVPYGKDGHLAVLGTDLVIGSAEMMAMDWYNGGGKLTRRVRAPGIDFNLPQSEIDAVRSGMLGEDLPPELRQLVEGTEIPRSRPAYSDLLIDSEGCVWAAEYHRRGSPEEPVDWEVFSPEGEWLGSVRTPLRFSVFDIGSDYILGVFRDDLDIEHVQLLRLDRN
ncbi:MAG: hypothetical protein MUO50_13765 [Longimicrobiales bacterium]|nr:hypothetical protein [Longimicrobiales bacterium]